jgi:uncharacterized membrane protein AbrB (regulator of aidB expression)
MWGYMVLSVLGLAIAGVIVAIILIKASVLNSATAYLSTSLGAISTMIFLSLDEGVNALIVAVVAVFHLSRFFFILKLIEYMR